MTPKNREERFNKYTHDLILLNNNKIAGSHQINLRVRYGNNLSTNHHSSDQTYYHHGNRRNIDLNSEDDEKVLTD